MEKEGKLFLVFALFFIVLSLSISAELNGTKVDSAYSCLQNKTKDCSTSLDDNIFTLLSLKTCEQKVLNASQNQECWPKGACNIKQTSQALVALKESGSDTKKAKDWLLSKTRTPPGIDWFLQIESNDATVCSIEYSGKTYQISIADNKKISNDAGSCLSLAQDNYWLKISPQCQNNEYKISCNKDFFTNTLFKEQSSSTIHVSEKIESASSGGTTKEQVNSSCFADGNICSYEGTLWASLFLNSIKEDISSYVPYIVIMADNNPKYLPEAFIYILLGQNYKNDLLLKQKSSKYWESSGDKYYDTALALLSLSSDEETEKTNSLDWLMESQGTDGCWQGSIKNTGFILYAIAPRAGTSLGSSTSKPSCDVAGYSCVSSFSCSNIGGKSLDAYSCQNSLQVCCDKKAQTLKCVEQAGKICPSTAVCFGGREAQSSDSSFGVCCVGGSCVPKDSLGSTGSTCESSGGNCRSFECESGETQNSSLECGSSSQVCCTVSSKSSSSYWWIWALVILIIFAIIGIIFRDKLREIWFRLKSNFKPKSGPSEQYRKSSIPPLYSGNSSRGMMPRRILPHQENHRAMPERKNRGELDEVLKKLKDLSK